MAEVNQHEPLRKGQGKDNTPAADRGIGKGGAAERDTFGDRDMEDPREAQRHAAEVGHQAGDESNHTQDQPLENK